MWKRKGFRAVTDGSTRTHVKKINKDNNPLLHPTLTQFRSTWFNVGRGYREFRIWGAICHYRVRNINDCLLPTQVIVSHAEKWMDGWMEARREARRRGEQCNISQTLRVSSWRGISWSSQYTGFILWISVTSQHLFCLHNNLDTTCAPCSPLCWLFGMIYLFH